MINIPPKPLELTDRSLAKNASTHQGTTNTSHRNNNSHYSATAASTGSTKPPAIVGAELLKQLQQGQAFAARVESSQTLSSDDQQRLQQVNPLLIKQLVNQTSNTQTAGNSSAITLGQKTTLYFVKLLIESSPGKPQTFNTITQQVLHTGQLLSLTKHGNSLSIAPNIAKNAQEAASSLIKETLPKLQDKQSVYPLLKRLETLPNTLKNALIHPKLQPMIQQSYGFTYSAQSLSQENTLKNALQQLVIPTEGKLADTLALKQDISNYLRSIISTIQQITATASSAKNVLFSNDSISLNKTDLLSNQGGSLQFSSQLTSKELDLILRELAQINQHSTASSASSVVEKPLPTSTGALFRLLGLPIPQHAIAQNLALPRVIEQYLRQLAEQTQARVQLNQIRSLGLDKSASENRPLQQFYVEVPLRFNEHVLPMQLSIEEHLYRERKDEQAHSSAQGQSSDKQPIKRQWQVFMSFDLPNNETLHTQLSLLEESVTTTLWAESHDLCEKTQNELSVLRDAFVAKGLNVDDIQCFQGQPLQKMLQPDYNLIDVKT